MDSLPCLQLSRALLHATGADDSLTLRMSVQDCEAVVFAAFHYAIGLFALHSEASFTFSDSRDNQALGCHNPVTGNPYIDVLTSLIK